MCKGIFAIIGAVYLGIGYLFIVKRIDATKKPFKLPIYNRGAVVHIIL